MVGRSVCFWNLSCQWTIHKNIDNECKHTRALSAIRALDPWKYYQINKIQFCFLAHSLMTAAARDILRYFQHFYVTSTKSTILLDRLQHLQLQKIWKRVSKENILISLVVSYRFLCEYVSLAVITQHYCIIQRCRMRNYAFSIWSLKIRLFH